MSTAPALKITGVAKGPSLIPAGSYCTDKAQGMIRRMLHNKPQKGPKLMNRCQGAQPDIPNRTRIPTDQPANSTKDGRFSTMLLGHRHSKKYS